MALKKFSFVIPAYNCRQLLRNTLEALNNQVGYGTADYEVIVVDDGSDDQTAAYIKGVNRNYELKYIYLSREPHSSRSRARNVGWKVALGEVIAFIDADSIVKPEHLAQLERFYSYEANLAVLGNRLRLPQIAQIDFDSLFEQYGFNHRKTGLLDTTYFIYAALSYNSAVIRTPGLLFATNNAAVPKKYLEAVCGFDEKFIGWGCEDLDLGYRLQLKTDIVFAINSKLEVLHQYHQRTASDFNELERNKRYLAHKYCNLKTWIPVMKEYEMWSVLEMPHRQYQNRFLEVNPDKYKKIVVEYHSGDDLQQLKEIIIRYSAMERVEIIIIDYCEATDLDIWVQLLGKRNSTPRYYPASRMIKRS